MSCTPHRHEGVSLQEMLDRLPAPEREAIEARTAELIAEECARRARRNRKAGRRIAPRTESGRDAG